jgi:hypothetical protein
MYMEALSFAKHLSCSVGVGLTQLIAYNAISDNILSWRHLRQILKEFGFIPHRYRVRRTLLWFVISAVLIGCERSESSMNFRLVVKIEYFSCIGTRMQWK